MQWIFFNALGALSWFAGLLVAKGVAIPANTAIVADDHRLLIASLFSSAGLALLLWVNLRSPA